MDIYRKLPELGLLSISDRDNVEALEKIYSSMNDYQKSFLTDDYKEGAEKYISRMKDIVTIADADTDTE